MLLRFVPVLSLLSSLHVAGLCQLLDYVYYYYYYYYYYSVFRVQGKCVMQTDFVFLLLNAGL